MGHNLNLLSAFVLFLLKRGPMRGLRNPACALLALIALGSDAQTPPPPIFTPPSGPVDCGRTRISITVGEPKASIIYTIDGSPPSLIPMHGILASPRSVSSGIQVPVTQTTRIRAIALIPTGSDTIPPFDPISKEADATYTCGEEPLVGLHDPGPTRIKQPLVPSWLWLPLFLLLGFLGYLFALHWQSSLYRGKDPFPSLSRKRIRTATVEDTVRALEARSQAIRRYLELTGNEEQPLVEFLDVPPGLPEVRLNVFALNDPARHWHASRLSIELEDDAYRLLERVTDAVFSFARVGRLESSQFPTMIRLERAARTGHKFPWRVVISTEDTDTLFALLSNREISRWCGIDVDIRRSSQTAMTQGRCREGVDGLEGVIGGVLEDARNGDRYGVTCAHVLSSVCPTVFWSGGKPANKIYTAEKPDAVFTKSISGCFQDKVFQERAVTIATSKDIERIQSGQTPLRMTPHDNGVRGLVDQGLASGFILDGVLYRGPHLVIVPKFTVQFGVIFPRSRRFSTAGDSGSWVVTEEGVWLGMIVGGHKLPNTTSFAILGQHLVNAFVRSQSASIPKSVVQAKSFFS